MTHRHGQAIGSHAPWTDEVQFGHVVVESSEAAGSLRLNADLGGTVFQGALPNFAHVMTCITSLAYVLCQSIPQRVGGKMVCTHRNRFQSAWGFKRGACFLLLLKLFIKALKNRGS